MRNFPPTLDMTPEGEFRAVPRPSAPVLGWKARLLLVALGSSFVLGVVASAALLLPVLLAAAVYGYVALRLRAGARDGRNVFRP
jgi:hypothetical protein